MKLKDEDADVAVAEKQETEVKIPRPKLIKTTNGVGETEPEGFDLKLLDQFMPYHDGDALPPPIVKTNKKGVRFLHKAGEPRFFFQGNELIKVYRGLGGKKTQLFWSYKEKTKEGNPNTLHQRMRKYLRKRGIPGA